MCDYFRSMGRLRDERNDLKTEVEWLRAIVEPLNELRDKEVSWVTIPHDNADFGGPCNVVDVSGAWTGGRERRFEGDSLADALQSAVAAERAAEGREVEG